MPRAFDSAKLSCAGTICQFYDPKSGSVLIGRFLRFLQKSQDEMLLHPFARFPRVGGAVHFPGQSARPLTELNIRRMKRKIRKDVKDVVSAVCVFVLFGSSLAHLMFL